MVMSLLTRGLWPKYKPEGSVVVGKSMVQRVDLEASVPDDAKGQEKLGTTAKINPVLARTRTFMSSSDEKPPRQY
ncbi:hypothetical protein BTVI_31372 [Pitangus sulphuratus]|nr:hypothetical protein BTVI_31372 [Pitangus sulphuratus]